MSIKQDQHGRHIYVEVRCAGRSGKCGMLIASIKDYFDNLVLVDHRMSDRKLPLDYTFSGEGHEWHVLSSCSVHGERIDPEKPGHWLEVIIELEELDAAVTSAKRRNRTTVIPVVAWE